MKALIFDLDGTLVDSVYGHVLAFQIAFAEAGLSVEAWRIHRHIGMSGDLLTQAMARDAGHKASRERLKNIEKRHSHLLRKLLPKPEPLPGPPGLLKDLEPASQKGMGWDRRPERPAAASSKPPALQKTFAPSAIHF